MSSTPRLPAGLFHAPDAVANSWFFALPWAMELWSSIGVPSEFHQMALGTVKFFNSTKGYGFIQPLDGGKDVFVHISAVVRAGLTGLAQGQTLEYEEVPNRGKTSADHLKVQR